MHAFDDDARRAALPALRTHVGVVDRGARPLREERRGTVMCGDARRGTVMRGEARRGAARRSEARRGAARDG